MGCTPVLGYGYQIHPGALKIIESLEEEEALEVLSSFPEKFSEVIVIEVGHVEKILEEKAVKKAEEPKGFGSKLNGRITQIYDGSGLIQRCPKCNRWIIDNFCIVHSDVEGVWDLRIKARFDDGKEQYTLIFKRDVTEKIAKDVRFEKGVGGKRSDLLTFDDSSQKRFSNNNPSFRV